MSGPGGLLSPRTVRDSLRAWPFWRLPLAAAMVVPAGLGWFWVKDNPAKVVERGHSRGGRSARRDPARGCGPPAGRRHPADDGPARLGLRIRVGGSLRHGLGLSEDPGRRHRLARQEGTGPGRDRRPRESRRPWRRPRRCSTRRRPRPARRPPGSRPRRRTGRRRSRRSPRPRRDVDRLVAHRQLAEKQYARIKDLADAERVELKLVDEQEHDLAGRRGGRADGPARGPDRAGEAQRGGRRRRAGEGRSGRGRGGGRGGEVSPGHGPGRPDVRQDRRAVRRRGHAPPIPPRCLHPRGVRRQPACRC